MIRKTTLSVFAIFTFIACTVACTNETNTPMTSNEAMPLDTTNLQKAVFASGCFWCVEAIYESVKGVSEVYSGYAGGHTKNPTYAASNTGKTGHAEAVEVWYDPSIVSFKTLVDVYYASQNIEQVNGQGPDKGSQYRSIVFLSKCGRKSNY